MRVRFIQGAPVLVVLARTTRSFPSVSVSDFTALCESRSAWCALPAPDTTSWCSRRSRGERVSRRATRAVMGEIIGYTVRDGVGGLAAPDLSSDIPSTSDSLSPRANEGLR